MPATVLNLPFQCRAVRREAITASHALSVERNEYFGRGIDSSTPFCVVASQASQIVFISSAAGPRARPTPVEMAPLTASTLSWSASLRKRSTVSFGLDSSSMTSSSLRPRIPPAALRRSAANWTPRSPDSPTGASTPALAARTPSRTGPLCARAGAASSGSAAATAPAPESLKKRRRVRRMRPPCGPNGLAGRAIVARARALMLYSPTSTSRQPGGHRVRKVLGYSWVDRRAGRSHGALRRQHLVHRSPGGGRHRDRAGLRHRRARAGTAAHADAEAADPPAPVHRPHALGSHPGVSVLRPRVHSRRRAERVRAARLPAEPRGGDGGADGVLVLPRQAARPALAHPLHRARGGLLPRRGRARGDAVPQSHRAHDRLPHDERRRHHRLRHRPRAVLEAGGGDPPPSGSPAPRRVHEGRRPGHPRRAVHRGRIPAARGLGPLDG